MSMIFKTRVETILPTIARHANEKAFLAHEALCAATMHAVQHGDVTLCDRILDALGKGTDRKLVIDWLAEFGVAKWNKKAAAFELAKGKRKEFGETFDELMAHPRWDEFGKEKEDLVREFDVLAKFKAVVTGYDNAKEKGKPTKNDWLAAKLAAMLREVEAQVA